MDRNNIPLAAGGSGEQQKLLQERTAHVLFALLHEVVKLINTGNGTKGLLTYLFSTLSFFQWSIKSELWTAGTIAFVTHLHYSRKNGA